MLQSVVFDMDGLMFDSHQIFIDAWNYAGEKVGAGKLGYLVKKALGYDFEKKKSIWIKEFETPSKFDEAYKHFERFMFDHFDNKEATPRKGLYTLLDFLKKRGAKIAVASNSPKYIVEKNIKSAKISDYFDAIVCVDMVKNPKPDPELYFKACEFIDSDPKNTFALEDSKTGIIAAYSAGCKPIMVPHLCQPDGETLNMIVAKYDDLEQVKIAFESGEIG